MSPHVALLQRLQAQQDAYALRQHASQMAFLAGDFQVFLADAAAEALQDSRNAKTFAGMQPVSVIGPETGINSGNVH